ncbi:USP31 isoform 3, partial [Pongo abelii]
IWQEGDRRMKLQNMVKFPLDWPGHDTSCG